MGLSVSSPSVSVKHFSVCSVAFAAVMWLGTPRVDIVQWYSWLHVRCYIFCRRLLVSWPSVGICWALLVRSVVFAAVMWFGTPGAGIVQRCSWLVCALLHGFRPGASLVSSVS